MKMRNRPSLCTKIYLLAGGAYIAAITKYLTGWPVTTGAFFILESLSFLTFLLIIYISIQNYRQGRDKIKELNANLEIASKEWDRQREALNEKINQLEEKENADIRFASYQDKVLTKLFKESKIKQNKHRLLHLLAESLNANAIILYGEGEHEGQFIPLQSYALPEEYVAAPFKEGEGLNGQAVLDSAPMVIKEVPAGYFPVMSGLGSSSKCYLYLLPVIKNNSCKYLLEILTFSDTGIEKMWGAISEKLVSQGIL